MADVPECTVKGLLADETERAVMASSAAVTQCAAIWNLLLMQRWLLCYNLQLR